MNKNILNSPEISDELNKYIAENVSPYLFIIGNYTPKTLEVVNEDATFILYCLNLYKCLIDGGICNQIDDIIKQDQDLKVELKNELDKFKEICRIAIELRSWLAHSVADNTKIENINKIFYKLIDKPYPKSTEDYKNLQCKINGFGIDIFEFLHKFIEKTKSSSKKDTIIKCWKEKIIYSYFKSKNFKDLLESRLLSAYKAKFPDREVSANKPKKAIAKWTASNGLKKDKYMEDNDCLTYYENEFFPTQFFNQEICPRNEYMKLSEVVDSIIYTNYKIDHL